ncbi:HAD family phosphatase [Paenibacillus sp. GSMTC-2017]|uniref:Cof-type HAD-IIB family hydrolase n=1 Tax=Paenibacillus sp. GSMTC-2017 TaxID=2794350 RepID=UPI0018D8B773|nr:Cof-type HAD-IIB family hydrolase [Paenibacillus sp. GSMTC-2017]MBH5318181.1 HAD family phosphatase [Paenibacillus sp. GSMTC-2017]
MEIKYKLIALDVDGTLLTDDHQLLDEVREAVREAAGKGAEIVLCTGRGPMGAFPVLEELGLSGTLITHNGAATVQSVDRSVLFQYDIDQRYIGEFISYCREFDIHYDLNTAFEMMVEKMTPEAAEMYKIHQAEPTVMSNGQQLPSGLVKLTLFGTKESMDFVQSYWEKRQTPLQIIRSGDLFIDVQHPGASKGEALRQLAEGRGIPREKILAIGNYFNDISMLQFAGLGIAMDNSPELVKEAADVVTGSNNDSGVASAIRAYI